MDGQAEINKQLVEKADVVFAIFHARLGTSTPRNISGTAEEMEQAIAGGVPVHVFFSEQPISYDHDMEQLAALQEFRKSLEQRGLYRTFSTEDDLRGLIRQSLEADVARLNSPTESATPADNISARLHARYDFREVTETDGRGRVRTRKKNERIVIRNDGVATAYNVTLQFEPQGDGGAPLLHTDDGKPPIFDAIAPNSEVGVITALFMGVALTQNVTLRWEDETGESHAYSHSMTL